jgi:hypothetical protein
MLSSRYIGDSTIYIKNIIGELTTDCIKGAHVPSRKPTEFGQEELQHRQLATHALHHSYYYNTFAPHIVLN